MRTKHLLLFLAVTALCGGGCYSASTGTPSGGAQTPPASTSTPSAPTSGTPEQTSSTAAMVDATWKTYTSKGKDFSFKWPSTGVNAPMWSVEFYKADAPEISDGCYVQEGATGQKLLNPQGVAFCRTQRKGAAAGTMHVTDAFATKDGDRYIVIEMTKEAYSAGAMGCSFEKEYPYSASIKTCIAFEDGDYDAILNAIISTFAYSKTP